MKDSSSAKRLTPHGDVQNPKPIIAHLAERITAIGLSDRIAPKDCRHLMRLFDQISVSEMRKRQS
jgi:hypothetical protein